jgi:predicted transcriptional regulator
LKKREPILIYMEILAVLFDGPKGPTRLAQTCNVNYGRLENFTKPLLEKELIRSSLVQGEEELAITKEGYEVYKEWLEVWRKLPLGVT